MSYTIQHYRQQKRNDFYSLKTLQPSHEDRLTRLEYENQQLKQQLQTCMGTLRRMDAVLRKLSCSTNKHDYNKNEARNPSHDNRHWYHKVSHKYEFQSIHPSTNNDLESVSMYPTDKRHLHQNTPEHKKHQEHDAPSHSSPYHGCTKIQTGYCTTTCPNHAYCTTVCTDVPMDTPPTSLTVTTALSFDKSTTNTHNHPVEQ